MTREEVTVMTAGLPTRGPRGAVLSGERAKRPPDQRKEGSDEGTTYKRKLPSGKTTWCLGIDVGKGEDGKRKRIFKSGFRLQDDADKELTRMMQEMNEGTLTKPDPRTLAEFWTSGSPNTQPGRSRPKHWNGTEAWPATSRERSAQRC
jgi:hypothetical protein